MIGFLRGKVVQLMTDYCLIDVNGVGYRVFVTGRGREKLRQGMEAMIYTYTCVREDAILLYGFADQEEYDLFQLLITVSGIGPKVALGVLSVTTPDKLCKAIGQKQMNVLTKLPGIGKKSAERMVLELKDKVRIAGTNLGDADEENLFQPIAPNSLLDETEAALMALGYNHQEFDAVLVKLNEQHFDDVPAAVKFALKELSKHR